ncbi:hypothetical protein VTL71DRAFT_6155 [Oculimacula yallundae]|uniref:SET domain-containing protein n=1 Tax=Oculimacula yallundae TaxID=86028 RepID=A0ABR4C257_9HELO
MSKFTPWMKNAEEKKKHANLASMFKEYAMPLYSHRSEQYNGKDFEMIGFFRYLGLFRHSCIPNSHFSYNKNQQERRAAIHATHNIRAGEEVTITYLPASSYDDHLFPDALQVLQRTFGRTCTCPIHTPAGYQAQANKTDFLKERKGRMMLQNVNFVDYQQRLYVLDGILKIYNKYQVFDIRFLRMFEEAIATACSNGDMARAAVFAFYTKHLYAKIEGAESIYGLAIRDMHRYKNSPGCHPKFKAGGPWASGPTQIPRAFNGDRSMISAAMKDWLWMRGPWKTLAHGSSEYRKLTGLGTLPFASFESEDEIVPFDIDARLGPWEEVYPRWHQSIVQWDPRAILR